MFERALIRKSYDENAILDVGLIAETLLFYKETTLILDRGLLIELLKKIGIRSLLYLLKAGYLKAIFVRNSLGIFHSPYAKINYHRVVDFEAGSNDKTKRLPGREELITTIFDVALTKGNYLNGEIRDFMDLVPMRKIKDVAGVSSDISNYITPNLYNQNYVQSAVRASILANVPGYALPPFNFKTIQTNHGLLIETDLNWEHLNAAYHNRVSPAHGSLTGALLLSSIADAEADMLISSNLQGDAVLSPSSTSIVGVKIGALQSAAARQQIDAFQQMTLENSSAIREAINSGERSFKDFIDVLDASQRFREWFHGGENDANQLVRYQAALREIPFINSLPAKIARWAICTGVGVLNPAAGLVLGVADTFLVERIFRGWQPNQFITNDLLPFAQFNGREREEVPELR